jgi:hypothetical protein
MSLRRITKFIYIFSLSTFAVGCHSSSGISTSGDTITSGNMALSLLSASSATTTATKNLAAGDFETISALGTIFYSNGQGHYCGYDWDGYLRAGGNPAETGIAEISSIPNGMIYDGTCVVGLGTQVWLAPLPWMSDRIDPEGSVDFMSLFTDQATDWSATAANVSVIKLYGEWVQFVATKADLQAIFTFANSHNMKVALETGPLNPGSNGCGVNVESFADSGFPQMATNILSAGGTLAYIDMDEPYYFASMYTGANACNWSASQVAQGIQSFIAQAKSYFPNVVVGEVEPIVPSSVSIYETWLSTYKQLTGAAIPYFKTDVNWGDSAWPTEVKALETYVKGQGSQFGIIYTGNDPTTDAAWDSNLESFVNQYEGTGGVGGKPDIVTFQSWTAMPDHVLPQEGNTFLSALLWYFSQGPLSRRTLNTIKAGDFKIGDAIYYSNGLQYCLYDSWAEYINAGGNADTSTVTAYSSIPNSMVSNSVCTIPVGNFRIGAAIYSSNGSHYCLYDSWSLYLADGGNPNVATVPNYTDIPSTMVSDGNCGTN